MWEGEGENGKIVVTIGDLVTLPKTIALTVVARST